MSMVQNNITAGQADGCARVTFWGQNLTDNKIGLYSFIIGLPQEGTSYDDGNILSRAVETEDVFNCRGRLATKQSGNQTVEEKTLNIDYNDDYNFAVNNINPLVNISTMKAILEGTKFTHGEHEVVVLGTQGFRWLGTPSFETLDTFYAFEQDGKLISPDQLDENGNPELVVNSIKAPYEKSALVMVEFIYSKAGITKGDRFVYCMPMNSTFNEGSGTSPNGYSIELERMTDKRSIGGYAIDGSGIEGMPDGEVYYLTADQLYYTAGADAPTVEQADGVIAVTADSAGTAKSAVYVSNGSSWDKDDTIDVKKGCKIIAKATSTDKESAPNDDTYKLLVASEDADSGDFAVFGNIMNATGTADYYFNIYDWIYSEGKFDAYEGQ